MDKITELIKHYGSRIALARALKLNSAEVVRQWQVNGKIPDWRIADVERLYRRMSAKLLP